ncbi:ribosomal protein S18 acetylase RimI-like enzyme [Breznakia sp. PF5-3]|uniref:GNAT family N-acetyltransferase n=1 Tax=unclassified Breznakia TaxID=2623764 RepID=UPI00240631D0|nr:MULTISPECIES: GNAT family N-acetyltransferase [unclassified Breznakia]MDL2276280.1 GNAT family N-acetyltransferase [Breznakia sp. OttesenSCG-928-G09]MDF9825566.1 ribosomal protein S18 acetylase RimI-like enzyme [Breznakia sp. PM6-1]MDF9835873.1 ribosomal protein S18 acetylase RimI-like enzyme [Breznakia sp. PF5-3]MDF9837618.1 ribosomal protein S18 acetylase RimI-like enzyme [Breznakia sp. PFB2-8]MDF9860001.1 ribosomal protein S18 acetylase RimI-like enzyme [Breznakia sp. PH5-24]
MIRLATIEDYSQMFALWKNTIGMGIRSLDDSKAGIQKFMKRNPKTNFVAVEDGTIIGTILCGHDGRRAYIYHMVIKEAYRQQGIAKQLVDQVIDALQKEDIYKVALVTYKTNKLGNAFWETIGFQKREDLNYRNLSLNIENV